MASYDDDEEFSNGGKNGKTKNNDRSFIMNDVPSDIDNESNDYQSEDEMEEIESAGQGDEEDEEIVDDDDREERKQSSSDSKKAANSSTKNTDRKKKSSSSSTVRRKSPARDPKPRSKKVDLAKTRYLWVSGVPVGTKSTQLEEIFAKHGKVLAIKIIRGGNNSLLGFVKLESHDQAQRCLDKLNKTEFRGSKIELFKERPVDKDSDGKKVEKIGFSESRKIQAKPLPKRPLPSFRPSTRGSFHRPPRTSLPSKLIRTPPIRLSSSSSQGGPHRDVRSHEREASSRLDRERQKLKMERLRFEQEKAEYIKIERKSRFEFERGGGSSVVVGTENEASPPNRIRSMIKRNNAAGTFDDGAPFVHHEEKRYDDYNRYDSRRSPVERKINPRSSFGAISGSRNNYETGSRPDRYSDLTSKRWQQPSMDSWMTTGLASGISTENRGWNSSAGYDHHTSPRILSSSIGSTSGTMSSRLNHSSDISRGHGGGGYYNNRRY
uniref:Scaffold attachment factor B1-like isoform X2 n=1 Tax=Dermatophagoides pteronyssinus TaxID=6956 RepID=A0A6P6YKU5_DERPT|nr:scaffold attachment factor B1-like isoform X2 [Dermatophagoides pteronyssinus]